MLIEKCHRITELYSPDVIPRMVNLPILHSSIEFYYTLNTYVFSLACVCVCVCVCVFVCRWPEGQLTDSILINTLMPVQSYASFYEFCNGHRGTFFKQDP